MVPFPALFEKFYLLCNRAPNSIEAPCRYWSITRSHGHLELAMKAVQDARDEKTVSTGISRTDGRVRSSRSYASGSVPGIRAVGKSIRRWLAQAVRQSGKRQAGGRARSMLYPISARTEAAAATMAATMPISFTIG